MPGRIFRSLTIFVALLVIAGTIYSHIAIKAVRTHLAASGVELQQRKGIKNRLTDIIFPSLYIKQWQFSTSNNSEQINLQQVRVSISPLRLVKLSKLPVKVDAAFARLTIGDLNIEKGAGFGGLQKIIKLNQDINIKKVVIEETSSNKTYVIDDFASFVGFSLKRNIKFTSDRFGKFALSGIAGKDSYKINVENTTSAYIISAQGVSKRGEAQSGSVNLQIRDMAEFVSLIDMNLHLTEMARKTPIAGTALSLKFNFVKSASGFKCENFMINDIPAREGILTDQSGKAHLKLDIAKLDLLNTQDVLMPDDENLPFDIGIFKNLLPKIFDIKIDEISIGSGDISISDILCEGEVTGGTARIQNFEVSVENQGLEIAKINASNSDGAKDSLLDVKVKLNSPSQLIGLQEALEDDKPGYLQGKMRLSKYGIYMPQMILKRAGQVVVMRAVANFAGSRPGLAIDADMGNAEFGEKTSPVIFSALQRLTNLADGMHDDAYYNKFIPVRQIDYDAKLNLFFTSFKNKNPKYSLDESQIRCSASPAKIAVDDFYLNFASTPYFLKGSGVVSAASIKPDFAVMLSAGYVSSLPDILGFSKHLSDNYDVSKADIKLAGQNIHIDSDSLQIQNLSFDITNDERLFTINDLTASLWSGDYSMEGSFLLSPFQISSIYSISSIDIGQMPNILQELVSAYNGGLSFSGSFTANGETYPALLYNLYTKSSLIGKSIGIKGYSMDDFAEKIESRDYKQEQLQDDLDKHLARGSGIISNLTGNFTMEKGDVTFSEFNASTPKTYAEIDGKLNIYDFSLDLSSNIYFKNLRHSAYGPRIVEDQTNKAIYPNISVKIGGSLLESEKQLLDSSDLENIIKARAAGRYLNRYE